MNRPFGVPALAGPDRLKAGLQTSGVHTDKFMVPIHAKKRMEAFHGTDPPTAALTSPLTGLLIEQTAILKSE